MKKDRQRKVQEKLVGIIFILTLFLFLIINVIVPDREKSVQENRMLATKPKFRLSSLISGDYDEKFEAYMDDQFVGRDMWRKLKVTVDRIGGSRLENGVYIGTNGQLLEQIEVADENHLAANIKAIKSFSESQSKIPVRMMLVPDAANVLNHSLPSLAKPEDQTQMFSMVRKDLGDSVEWIDVSTELNKHKTEKIYYKTDHHWTTLGAFYAFQAAAPSLGIEGDLSGKYVSYAVSDSFNGMLASKSGVNLGEKEQIDIYVPTEEDTDLIVDYVDEGKRSTSLYDSSKLKEKDQYTVFLGGNSSLLDIRTVSTSTKRLLLVKDSFANSFIPFLTPYYREIVVVDPRYYSGTINDLMDSYRISEVLFLYSGNTFFKDNNISGVFTVE
ncbi:DHHW family protein [Mediterraneibacter faecis]|uniref:DHHW family protein n=1 Tax=Mediterraneibacter faecis TaxID=592978 RepID=UPI0022E6D955|nr:DHHW family protein [Mediterraneibacter faecis]